MNFIIPEQLHFRPELPHIVGGKDFEQERDLFIRIDEILNATNLENEFLELSLMHYHHADHREEIESDEAAVVSGKGGHTVSESWIKHTRCAFRVNIARAILKFSLRDMSKQLATNVLLHWFCGIGRFGAIIAPSKSTVGRYARWIDGDHLRPLIEKLLGFASDAENLLELEKPIHLSEFWIDATCVKANIHYPTDWVLLRDATRTLMKATTLIRREDLKNRMPQSPADFLCDINRLAIEMTQKARNRKSKKGQKAVLRKMVKLVDRVERHASKHKELLEERREETGLSEKEAAQIIKKIDNVVEQLPKAKEQAEERILKGNQVDSKEKILSLYEDEINVIKRGKANAAVEFGNVLWLAENREGLIGDWCLYRENVADNAVGPLTECVERLQQINGKIDVEKIWTDRGMDSEKNREMLKEKGIFNGIYPKSVKELQEKMKDESYVAGQRRRGSTEARIAIFKKGFLGDPLRAKGFESRKNAVAWGVLAHNLWVLGRQARTKEAELDQAA